VINDNPKNFKQAWKAINELTGRSSSNNMSIPKNINSTDINNFFSMLGANAIANMPVAGKYVTNFDPVVASFAFETINAHDVELVTMALRRSYSCGHDEISSYILTRIISYISLPLSVIFNKSVLTGTVPQHFKIAKVIPIFKAGDNTKLINYRPISLLSTFSKVLERLIYNKVIKFIEKHKILSLSQYGLGLVIQLVMLLLISLILLHII
jgi:hypothetical protein